MLSTLPSGSRTKSDKSLLGLPFELLMIILEQLEPQDIYNLLLIEPKCLILRTVDRKHRLRLSRPLRDRCILHNIKFGGLSALECAAQSNDRKTVNQILQTAAEIAKDSPIPRNITSYAPEYLWSQVLTFAVRHCYRGLVARMLKFEDVRSYMIERNELQHALFQASEFGDVAMIRLLIDNGADPEARHSGGDAPLILTTIMGHFDASKLLLTEYHVDPNAADWDGITALHGAAQLCSARMVELLLSHGAEADVRGSAGCTPLEIAAENGGIEVARLLLAHGARPDYHIDGRQTPLALAAQNGHEEIVRLLLDDDRVDLNGQNSQHYTPLMEAVMGPYVNIARLLLDSGRVDPNRTNARGETALHLALIWDSSFKMAELLLSMKNIKPDEKDQWGITPVMIALSVPSSDRRKEAMTIITRLVTSEHVDLNARSRCDNTPIDYAIRSGDIDSVKLLLHTGRVSVTNHQLAVAHLWGNAQIVNLIEENMHEDILQVSLVEMD